MKINPGLRKSIAVLVVLVVMLMAACSQPAEPAMDETMAIDGEALLQDRCTKCHDLERTTSKNKDEAGWTQTVENMVGKGATLTAEEQAALIDYLVENYGPE